MSESKEEMKPTLSEFASEKIIDRKLNGDNFSPVEARLTIPPIQRRRLGGRTVHFF